MSSIAEEVDMSASGQSEIKASTYGWIVCGLGALFYSYEYLLRISPSVMTAELMQHFNVNAALLGGVSAFYYNAYVPMQLPVGMLMDRYGPRRLLTLACATCVIGTYLFVGTKSPMFASLGRFLVGFGSAFAFVGVLKLATIWLPPSRFALFTGLSAALGTIGAMTGVIWLTRLVHTVGWMQTLYLSAMCGIILTMLIWLVMRDRNPNQGAKPTPELTSNNTLQDSLRELVIILSNPQMWVVGLIGCFIYLPTTAFGELWGIPYLQHARLFTPVEAAWAINSLFLGFTIGAPLMGWLSDVLHTRRKLLLISALLSTMLASILIYTPSLSHQQIYMVLFCLGLTYSAQALVFVVGREISPPGTAGTAIAVTNMIVMLGGIVFQPIIGDILEWVWDGKIINNLHVYTMTDFQLALSVIPFGIFLSAIMCLFLKETYGTVKAPEPAV